MTSTPDKLLTARQFRYWTRVKRITLGILGVWITLILGSVTFAFGSTQQLFGIPLSYWIISGGLLLSFLLLVICYAVLMDRLDASMNMNATVNSRDAQANAGDKDETQPGRGRTDRH